MMLIMDGKQTLSPNNGLFPVLRFLSYAYHLSPICPLNTTYYTALKKRMINLRIRSYFEPKSYHLSE